MNLLGQTPPPISRIDGIRDQFSVGGSPWALLGMMAGLLAVALLLYFFTVIVNQRRRRRIFSPRKLFGEILVELPLTAPQRELLRRMVRQLRLPHPAMILLSPQVFRTHANRWMSAQRRANDATRQRVDAMDRALFKGAVSPQEGE